MRGAGGVKGIWMNGLPVGKRLHLDEFCIMMHNMRTTVDIPEGLLRRARSRAALEGRRLKDVVNEALERWLVSEKKVGGWPSDLAELLPPDPDLADWERPDQPENPDPKRW